MPNKIKMVINGKEVQMTIDKMICKDCAYRFKNNTVLQILNCQKYPFGKPYNPNLTKNKCLLYSSEDEQDAEINYKKKGKNKNGISKKFSNL